MGLIDIDATFDQRRLQRLRHQLAAHPLMTTQCLAELALRMDPEHVRFHDGERRLGTQMTDLLLTDPTRQRLRRAIDNLHKATAFVQILNVRSDPAYRLLIDELFDEVLPCLPPRDRQLFNRDAAAFLASPGSMTPFHLDHEQNFLCHIRGAKTLYVWDHRDRRVVSERALEIFYREGTLREASYQPAMQAHAQAFELTPGDCVYMPMGSPHAVSTGREITVTFSALMNTRSAFETVETYRANHVLRGLGLSPTPVGDSRARDSLKRHTVSAVRRVRNFARGRRGERRLHWY
jgi:cupin-like protein